MNRTAAPGLFAVLIIAVALFAFGCGGDGGGGVAPAPQPAAGTATVQGQIVGADNPGTPIANAVITVEGLARSVTSGADGRFAIANLPAGDWLISVITPQSEEYGTSSARVTLGEDETATVSMAVLPLGLAAPEQIPVSYTHLRAHET